MVKGGLKMSEKELTTVKEPKDAIMAMAQVAVEKADVGTLERLVELRKQMKEEKAREEFFKSLSAFQSELKPIKKSKVVKNKDGTIRYSYATFDDIIEAIQPLLERHGLSYRFETEFEGKSVNVKCIITHLLGHQEITSFKTVVEYSGRMLPIQEWGSALTYAKRYSLSLALGLATEEDTDAIVEGLPEETTSPKPPELHERREPISKYGGEGKTQPEVSGKAKKASATSETITEPQRGYISMMIQKKGWSHADAMKVISDIVGKEVEKVDSLTKEEAIKVITKLKEEPF